MNDIDMYSFEERITSFLYKILLFIIVILAIVILSLFYEKNNNETETQKIKNEKCLTSIGKIKYVNGETIIKFDDSISSYTYSLTHSEWK